jgi:glycosyltransferase involved in cell wall biosynthesis
MAHRVHILVPTYEPDPAHLRQAIESALGQTERQWKMIVHDDASTTDVESIMKPYMKDRRIGFFRAPRRRGIGANWNACMKFASAPFIQYLFQDDMWSSTYLERMLAIMKANPRIGFASAHHRYVCEGMELPQSYEDVLQVREGEVAAGQHEGKAFLRWWLKRGLHPNVIGEPSFVMIRRSVLVRSGRFADDLLQGLDGEQWVRMLLVTDWFWCPESLGTFRVHPEGTSARNQESGAGLTDRLEAFERLIGKLPRGELRSAAVSARNTALANMAKKYMQRAGSGKRKAGSNGSMKRFALRHPVVTLRVLLGAWRGRSMEE